MKKLLIALFAAVSLCAVAHAQSIGTNHAFHFASSTATPPGVVFPSSVTSGNALLVTVNTSANVTVTINDSLGNVFTPCQTLGGTASRYVAIYSAVAGSSGADTVTVSYSVAANSWIGIAEVTGISNITCDTAATIATGSSTTPTSNSATPAGAGELAVASFSTGLVNISGPWTNSYTNIDSSSGNALSGSYAYKVVSAATSAADTISASSAWTMALALFKSGGGGSSCTHPARLQNVTISVPTAGSTVVWLKSGGAFGTVDCSATQYFQPTNGGAFGAN